MGADSKTNVVWQIFRVNAVIEPNKYPALPPVYHRDKRYEAYICVTYQIKIKKEVFYWI